MINNRRKNDALNANVKCEKKCIQLLKNENTMFPLLQNLCVSTA